MNNMWLRLTPVSCSILLLYFSIQCSSLTARTPLSNLGQEWLDTGKMTHSLTKRERHFPFSSRVEKNGTFSLREEPATHRSLRNGTYVCWKLRMIQWLNAAQDMIRDLENAFVMGLQPVRRLSKKTKKNNKKSLKVSDSLKWPVTKLKCTSKGRSSWYLMHPPSLCTDATWVMRHSLGELVLYDSFNKPRLFHSQLFLYLAWMT